VGVQKHQIYLDVLNGWPQNHWKLIVIIHV
jgi:hypothetical protein